MGLSGRKGGKLRTHHLEGDETIVGKWVAGVPWANTDGLRGRLARYGGDLVLTDRRLLFDPLKAARDGGRLALDLSSIAMVEAFSTRSPPRLKVTLHEGTEVVFGVMRGRTTTMWSKDSSARDEAVEAITAATRRPATS